MQFYTWHYITLALLHSIIWRSWQLGIWAQTHQTNIQELAVTKSDCPVASCRLSRTKTQVIYLIDGLKGCQQQLSRASPVGHTAQTRPQDHICSTTAPTLPDDRPSAWCVRPLKTLILLPTYQSLFFSNIIPQSSQLKQTDFLGALCS